MRISLSDFHNERQKRKRPLEDPKYQEDLDEAIEGILNGIPTTVATDWLLESHPDLNLKRSTCSHYLGDYAKKRKKQK